MEQVIVNILMAFFSAIESHPEWLKQDNKWGKYMLRNMFICGQDILAEVYRDGGPSALWAIDTWANAHEEYYFQMANLEAELRKAHKAGALNSISQEDIQQKMLEPLTVIYLAQQWIKERGSLEGFPLKKLLNILLENREWFIREDGTLISDQIATHTHRRHTPVSIKGKSLVRTSDSYFKEEGQLWITLHAAQLRAGGK